MPARPAISLERYGLALAILVMTLLFSSIVARTSVVVDGTRYFYLDDDQMVSMRYARNLANGDGLVWNPGEHVEGYTSLGWTLVMAAVHLLPLTDATTSLAVKVVSWLLACGIIVLTDRLLRRFIPQPGLTRPAVLVGVALCTDLLFWAANGFETPLLTAVLLLALTMLLDDVERGAIRVSTCLVIGLLPVARSDAYHLWAAVMVIAVGLGRDITHVLRRAPIAALIPVVQLALRRWYYGEWLPNTYFLKVAGTPGLFWSGTGYVKSFLEAYTVPILLTAAGVAWAGDRRSRWIPIGIGVTFVYVFTVGADNFPYFRFFAPWVPVLFVLGAAAAWRLSGAAVQARAVLVMALLVVTTVQSGVHGRTTLQLGSRNGTPEHGLVAALMIRDYTQPDASVAVTAAGTIPYFSRRPSLDLLGKTDAHVAHLPPHVLGPIGHKKFDIDFSLSKRPDLIVTFLTTSFGSTPESAAYVQSPQGQHDYRVAILNSRVYQDDYASHPIPLPFLLENGAIYVRRDSPEVKTIDRWRLPAVSH